MTTKPLEQPEFNTEQDGPETPPTQQTRFAEDISIINAPQVTFPGVASDAAIAPARPRWQKPALFGGGIFALLMIILVIARPRGTGVIEATPTPTPVGNGSAMETLNEIERRFVLLDKDMEVAEPFGQELSFPPISFALTLEDATAVQAKTRR